MLFSRKLGRRRRYDAPCLTPKAHAHAIQQAKEDASDLINEKAELEKRKKAAEDAAAQKELERDRKIRPIGNYVHESVPVSNNEARSSSTAFCSYSIRLTVVMSIG